MHIIFLTILQYMVIGLIVIAVISVISSRKKLKSARQCAQIVLTESLKLESEIKAGIINEFSVEEIRRRSGMVVILGDRPIDNVIVIAIKDNELQRLWSMKDYNLIHWAKSLGWI